MSKEPKEKDLNINDALEKLQKKYGKDVVMQMDKDIDFKVESIPTGCFSLDAALGCGGLPRGRVIEIFGQESSGKSTLATFFIAQLQKNGGKAALVDAECAFDGEYAKNIGVDVSKLLVSQPSSLEEAMDVVRELVKTKSFDIIVIDSVAALTPKSEIEGEEMLKDTMAVQARLLGKALRILASEISKSRTVVIFINQVREKVGVFFGNKETTPGGKALKFFSSVRMNVTKGEKIMEGDAQIGNWMNVTMVKNKVSFPWRKASFELYYNRGIDLIGDALDYGEKVGIIPKKGNTYNYHGQKMVGRDTAKEVISHTLGMYKDIRQDIINYNEKARKTSNESKEQGDIQLPSGSVQEED